jgi:hypothetical protein
MAVRWMAFSSLKECAPAVPNYWTEVVWRRLWLQVHSGLISVKLQATVCR